MLVLQLPQHAFVINADDIKKFCRLLGERIGPVTIDTKTSHDIERQFTDVKALLDIENPWEKRIVDLRISARSEDWKKRATVRFSETRYSPIDVEVSASEVLVERIRQDLVDILRGVRPWYSRIARIDFVLASLVVLGCLSITASAIVAFGIVRVKEPNAAEIYNREIRGLVLAAIVFLVGWIANRLRTWLFPVGVIAIGQVVKRNEILEKTRWGVVIGFLVSFAASVAVLFPHG